MRAALRLAGPSRPALPQLIPAPAPLFACSLSTSASSLSPRYWRPTPTFHTPRLHTLRCCMAPRTRTFGTTPARAARDHYDALGLPRNASKQQIKARFYELSKKYHPDAPTGSPDQFHKINDAYAILGDDAARATYDAQHAPRGTRYGGHGHGHGEFHPHSPQARRAAGPHRAWGGRPPPGPAWTGKRRTAPDLGWGMGMGGTSGTPPPGAAGAWGRKETPTQRARAQEKEKQMRADDAAQGESIVGRFVVVVVVLLAIIGMGRGFTARADTGEWDEEPGEGWGAWGDGEGEGVGEPEKEREGREERHVLERRPPV